MDRSEAKIIIPLIAFIIGWFATGHFFAGVAIAGLVAYIRFVVLINPEDKENENIFGEENDFIHAVLLLSAIVIKADGRIYKQERDLVRARLSHDFDPANVERYMADLEVCLKKKVRLEAVCHSINANMSYPARVQLLHFLAGLTVTNGLMVDSEFYLLRKIARLIKIPERTMASLLAMFNFTRIRSYDNAKSNYRQGSYSSSSSTSSLSQAYQILEIMATATNDEVKKAYRKLAKLHHPDRVTHLGPEFQKSAKLKFQKIADAYELIKDKRGFK